MNRVEPNRNVYVGHRYVPLLVGEWDKSVSYEGLSIVTYQGASYTSKKRVPVGIDIENEEFWTITGNYNAQVEYYREETERVSEDLKNKASHEALNDFKSETNQSINDFKTNTNKNIEDFTGEFTEGLNDANSYSKKTNFLISNDEEDYNAIKKAVDFVNSNGGGSIDLGNREFDISEGFSLNNLKNITLKGNGAKIKSSTSGALFSFENSENIKVEGIDFISTYENDGIQRFLRLTDCSNVYVKGCNVKNAAFLRARTEENTDKDRQGEFIYHMRNYNIKGCSADANMQSVNIIDISSVDGFYINDCIIKRSNYDGIKTSGLESRNIEIIGCHFREFNDHAIDQYGSGGEFTVEGNFFENLDFALSLKSTGHFIDSQTGEEEPVFTDSFKSSITKNIFRRCRGVIHAPRLRNMSFEENIVHECKDYNGKPTTHLVMVSGDHQNVYINNNVFKDNNTAPEGYVINMNSLSNNQSYEREEFKKVVIENNLFQRNSDIQIFYQTIDGDTSTLHLTISSNTFIDNNRRAIFIKYGRLYSNIYGNFIKSNLDGIFLSGDNVDTRINLTDNNVFVNDGLVLYGGADVRKENGNNWNDE